MRKHTLFIIEIVNVLKASSVSTLLFALIIIEIYHEFYYPSFREVFILKLQYILHSNLLTPSLFWFAQRIYRALSKQGIAVGSSSTEELECSMNFTPQVKFPFQKQLKQPELNVFQDHDLKDI